METSSAKEEIKLTIKVLYSLKLSTTFSSTPLTAHAILKEPQSLNDFLTCVSHKHTVSDISDSFCLTNSISGESEVFLSTQIYISSKGVESAVARKCLNSAEDTFGVRKATTRRLVHL